MTTAGKKYETDSRSFAVRGAFGYMATRFSRLVGKLSPAGPATIAHECALLRSLPPAGTGAGALPFTIPVLSLELAFHRLIWARTST